MDNKFSNWLKYVFVMNGMNYANMIKICEKIAKMGIV